MKHFYGEWALPIVTRVKSWGEEPQKKARKDFSDILAGIILSPAYITSFPAACLHQFKHMPFTEMVITGLTAVTAVSFLESLNNYGKYAVGAYFASLITCGIIKSGEQHQQEQELKNKLQNFTRQLPFTEKVTLQMVLNLRQHLHYPEEIGELLYGVYQHFQQYND